MQVVLKQSQNSLFSKSAHEREVEVSFARRLVAYTRTLSAAELHALVVSGKFNEIFPALDDETSPVTPRRFDSLKPFDYEDWARRNKVEQ